ncbi:flagellar biosynthetic protein FliO [Peribacillus acanthi]|uniref:flagellar biosynthetic protein FliO n=1 Tax=Peribacillus acanthi TaxID=2171554 RepID=UPI001F0C8F5C|nr:flagellar biosynthetic protein FliO [Peribacillus acanthi]
MVYLKKTIYFLVITTIVLLGLNIQVHAEQGEKSVKEFYQPKEKNDSSEKILDSKKDEEIEASVGLTFFDFLRMILATIFVVALLYFILKFINKKSRAYQKVNYVQNLGGTSLGGNRSIQLVKLGNRVLVVGVGEDIQLLKEIDNEDEYSSIMDNYQTSGESDLQSSNLFAKLVTKKQGTNYESFESFTTQLREQLSDFSNARRKIHQDLKKEKDRNE